MSAITSIYIPHVEKNFDAKYVANVFEKNGIAQVSKVHFESYNKNKLFNRAYVEIENWYETKAALNFVQRLCNPSIEARIVHSDDNWWVVDINRNTSLIYSDKQKTDLLRSVVKAFNNSSLAAQITAHSDMDPEIVRDFYYKSYYNHYIAARNHADQLDKLREMQENANKHRLLCYEDGVLKEIYVDDIDLLPLHEDHDYLMEQYAKYVEETSSYVPYEYNCP